MAKNLKAGKSVRVALDFKTVEAALEFMDDLKESGFFEGIEVGLREADVLDLKSAAAYTLMVRSMRDVRGHPGAVDPLPERGEDEPVRDYLDRLTAIQRAAAESRMKEVV